ncbi:hypothetical protein ACFL3V_07175 [Nanoarchaeota archaeon]
MKMRYRMRDAHRRLGKKAFITDVLVDFWSYILFVLVVIVFAVVYKYSAEAKLQQIEDVKDVTYGNYLAQVYLRTPLDVGNTKMDMAELIALYDYNQSLEKEKDRSYAQFWEDKFYWVMGKKNPMLEAIDTITADFVDKNFDEDRCFVFSIRGNAFETVRRSHACPGARTFSTYYLFIILPGIPNSTYVTYIAPVDPRDKPIAIYSIYDIERLLSLYAPDEYFDMDTAAYAAARMREAER